MRAEKTSGEVVLARPGRTGRGAGQQRTSGVEQGASEDDDGDSKGEPLHLGGGLWLLGMREAGSPEESYKGMERGKGLR